MAINLPPKKTLRASPVAPLFNTQFNAVTATTTVSKLVRENINRKEVIVTNTSTAPLYIAFGFLPSTTNYAVSLLTGASFLSDTTDALNGVWASAGGGQANITERF